MVNAASVQLPPPEALDQMGEALPRLIAAIAVTLQEDEAIVFSNLDIKDGYWRL